jgi:O-antigen ligase
VKVIRGAALTRHWRGLRWAPPLLAIAITGETVMGGSNGWASRPAAVLVNLMLAGMILMAIEPSSRLWVRMRTPLMLFTLALLWAVVPRLLPAGWAAMADIPVDPAPDRLLPTMAEAISRVALVMAACAATYRLQAARPLLWWLAAMGGLYAGWMILTPLPWQSLAGAGRDRFAATIGNWNAAGAYFGIIATLALAALLAGPAPLRRGWPWLFALPLTAALLLCMATQSRLAFTLTAVSLVTGLMWQRRAVPHPGRKRRAMPLLLPLGLVIMAVAYWGSDALFPRYRALSADGLSRWDIVTTYWSYTLDSPLWGWGLGSFFELNQAQLTPATALRFWSFGAAHNAPLQIALEAGWPALLLLVAGVAVIGRDVIRQSWGAEEIGCAGALAIVVGASLVDIAWNVPAIGALSCVLLGTLWGARPARRPGTQLIRRSSTGRARGVPVTS